MRVQSYKMKYHEVLIQFLKNNETRFIDDWHHNIKIDEFDLHWDKVRNNGLAMYELIMNAMAGLLTEDILKHLAYKIASERLEANINIGDFVFNVNLGRKIIVKHVLEINIPIQDLQLIIDDINEYFDFFLYHAVTRYTNIKNKVIEEKTFFISEHHKDKLALLGQISSSFVHEFRNPLTAVMGFNKILRKENPNLKYLDIIDYELNQLNFRITQFLHTSKAEFNEGKREQISVLDLMEEIKQLTYASIVDASITVHIDISLEMVLNGNRDGLKQVFLNLFINSIDALSNREQPRILNVYSEHHSTEQIINISNNGPTIASEYIESIFEPFFTTKELGTGIGLYVCKKIIERCGGYIDCISNDECTTFRLHFSKAKI